MRIFWNLKRLTERTGNNGITKMTGSRLLKLCIRRWSTSEKKRLMGLAAKRLPRSRNLCLQWPRRLLMDSDSISDSDLKREIGIQMEGFKRNVLDRKVVVILVEKNPEEGIRERLSQDAGAMIRLITRKTIRSAKLNLVQGMKVPRKEQG
jgi:hypothetical protein